MSRDRLSPVPKPPPQAPPEPIRVPPGPAELPPEPVRDDPGLPGRRPPVVPPPQPPPAPAGPRDRGGVLRRAGVSGCALAA